MADQVKFIHQALGESTISNMATEATLRELLEAIGGGQSPASRANSLAGLKNPFNSLASKAKSLENAIKGTMRPFTGFVSLLHKGEVRMSAFGQHLNDSLIKKLPFVGGLLGGVADITFAGVGILEKWNTESKKLAPLGATFGNSFLEFAEISAKTRLSMSELNSVVGSNIEKLSALGPNINQGVRNFASFSNAFFRPGNILNEKLYRMGYGFQEINENMIDFLYFTRRTSADSIETNAHVQKSFMSYMRNLDSLTKVFGLNRDQVHQASQKILKDSIFQIQLNKESPLVGEKTAMAAQAMSAMFGPEFADIFKGFSSGIDVFGGEGFKLEQMMGGQLRGIMEQIDAKVKDKDFNSSQFEEFMLDIMAKTFIQSRDTIDGRKNLINMMSVMPELNGDMYNVISTIADTLSRKDLQNMTEADVRKVFAEARSQQKQTDTITEIINAMKMAATYFSGEFQTAVVGELKRMGVALEDYNLPELFTKAGEWAAEFTVKAWDWMQEFFKMLGDSDGREYLKESFILMSKTWGSKIYDAVSRGIAILFREAFELIPGGKYVTQFWADLNDAMQRKFGFGLPFTLTEKEYENQSAETNYEAYMGQSRLSRLYETKTNKGGKIAGTTIDPKDTSVIQPGTIIYPDYAALGTDNLGPLRWDGKQWKSVVSEQELAKLPEEDDFADPESQFYYSNLYSAALENQTIINRLVNDRPDLAGRLTTLAQRSKNKSSNLGMVYTRGGYTVMVNKRFADKYQNIVDLLEGMGLNISGLTARGDFKSKLEILTEGHGKDWYRNLKDYQQRALLHGLTVMGLTDKDDNAKLAPTLVDIMEGGLITTMPGEPVQFRNGTLLETGRLFNDFGRKRQVEVSGDKAVLTKPQFDTIKEGAAQIPMKDLVNSVNSNVQEMIRLTKLEILYNKSMLSVA